MRAKRREGGSDKMAKTLKKHFPTQRRIAATLISAAGVYIIVKLLGEQLGIATSIDNDEFILIVLSAGVGAFVSKWVHDFFKVKR
jgi:hypothetical protein